MAAEARGRNAEWVWTNCGINYEGEGAYEHTLIRAVDTVRIALVLILFGAALLMGTLIVNVKLFSLGLFIGALLSLWARFEADWELLRGLGKLPGGAAVLAIGDIAWLSLVIVGSGGLTSPFAGLLVLPILYSVALFRRLRTAPLLIAAITVLVYLAMAVGSPGSFGLVGGQLTTVLALAFLSYAVCQILERERRSSEVMMRELSEGVILLDSTGRIIAANRQIERLTNVGLGCMVGRRLDQIAGDTHYAVLTDILAEVQTERKDNDISVREITVPGRDALDLLCTTIRLPGLVGERIGHVVVCEDVTAIKSALRARDGGEASLRDDLQSPTAVLKVASSMLGLLAEGMHKEDHQRVVEVLDLDARALVSNVATLMNVSSLEDPGLIANLSRTDVTEMIRRVRRRLSVRASRRGITVSEEIQPDLGEALLDAPRIEDALHRLCDNAIRHSPNDDRVCIRAEEREGNLEISVSDRGPGVPEGAEAEIFEKFVQLEEDGGPVHDRGLGLGLSIVSRIADLHDGEVTVQNRPEGGAVFTIRLPMEPGATGDRSSQSEDSGDARQAAVAS